MSKKELEKNALDLAYKKQLTHLNVTLILGTVGLLSFIGTFIWNKEYLIFGLILTIIIIIISYMIYKKIDNNLKEISNNIRKL